jgi:DNA-binding MarR family transcriptional regulator
MNSMNFLETLHGLEVKFINLFFKNITMPASATKINPTAARCLLTLYYEEQMPMSKIAEQLHIEKGSFTTVAKKLETMALIERFTPADDRRLQIVQLTPSGNKLAKVILQSFSTHMESVFARLPKDQSDQLIQAVERLNAALTKALAFEQKSSHTRRT